MKIISFLPKFTFNVMKSLPATSGHFYWREERFVAFEVFYQGPVVAPLHLRVLPVISEVLHHLLNTVHTVQDSLEKQQETVLKTDPSHLQLLWTNNLLTGPVLVRRFHQKKTAK